MRKVFRPAVWNSYNLRGQIGGGTNSSTWSVISP